MPPCTGGGSGGAGQVNCALTHHGLEDRVDLAVPWSGFWMERLDIWCLDDDPRNGELHYSGSACRAMDRSYGFLPDQGGPCVRRDESFRPAFTADSLSAGGDLSARLQTEVGYYVLLPLDCAAGERRYPALYPLHGANGSENSLRIDRC